LSNLCGRWCGLAIVCCIIAFQNPIRGDVRQDTLDQRLITAIRHHDAHAVKEALQQGGNPNAQTIVPQLLSPKKVRVSALMLVFELSVVSDEKTGNPLPEPVAIVEALLKRGARVQDRYSNGIAIIVRAVLYKYVNCVRLLLDHGADVNTVGANGNTLLIDAVEDNDLPMVRLLLQHHADVTRQDWLGGTALSYSRQPAIIKLLRQAGAKK
jgi:hypothetical protein